MHAVGGRGGGPLVQARAVEVPGLGGARGHI